MSIWKTKPAIIEGLGSETLHSAMLNFLHLNLGIGEEGGGSQESPLASSLAKAEAMARAGGDGKMGLAGAGWPRLWWRIGDPTHNFKSKWISPWSNFTNQIERED